MTPRLDARKMTESELVDLKNQEAAPQNSARTKLNRYIVEESGVAGTS